MLLGALGYLRIYAEFIDITSGDGRDRVLELFLSIYGIIFVLSLLLAFLVIQIVKRYKRSESKLTETNKALEKLHLELEAKVEERTSRLEQSLVREEAILDSIGEGMIVVDKDKKIIAVNDAAQRMTGWSDLSIIGRDITEALPMEDDSHRPIPNQLRPVCRAVKNGERISTTGYYTRIDGHKFAVALTVTPLMIKKRIEGAMQIMHDVTREKEIDKAKSEFISIASHQLNTPLGIIKWSIDSLKSDKKYAALPAETRETIDDIERNNTRMIDLVLSLLSVSRIEQKKSDEEAVRINIKETIESILSEIYPEAEKAEVEIETEYSFDPPDIYIDKNKFHEVLENLFTNAIKYNRPGGKVRILVEPHPEGTQISVTDTGIGIPDADKENIFGKFFRANNAALSDTKGTGLGLYVVKSYLDRWNWWIWFDSEEGRGTTFNILVPKNYINKLTNKRKLKKDGRRKK